MIVTNQMGSRSQALSSRQRVPPSVYPSANNGARAPPHVRVKWSVAAFGRRPWVAQGRGAVGEKMGLAAGKTWGAVAVEVRSGGYGTPLRLGGATG